MERFTFIIRHWRLLRGTGKIVSATLRKKGSFVVDIRIAWRVEATPIPPVPLRPDRRG